jgi:uroporphyrinogen III methyltransferase / synthase
VKQESKRGIVYLVGAGPGDPGLITRRGWECLKIADVVVYDRLIPPQLIKEARADARLIYVGKQAADHAMRQEEINALLAQEAQAGLIVCRLKGGDPYIFGRGGEEALYLAERGIAFEEVPGVTSAIAAPAYAGIPLTHREWASSVAFVTGQEDADKPESTINWEGLAQGPDTLVFLMGLKNLPEIVAKLIEHGKAPDTPAALVRMGTTPQQQTVIGTLADIVAKGNAAGLTPPVATVVGEVVKLHDSLCWFERRPLFGKRIVVTRAREQASELSVQLSVLGAEVIEFPTIKISPLPVDDAALSRLSEQDWIIFTSANAVRILLEQLHNLGKDIRALGNAKLASIGPGTSAALEALGLRVDFQPTEYVAEKVLEEFPEATAGKRIMIPRAKQAREVLPEGLRQRGAQVEVYPVYETLPDCAGAQELLPRLLAGEVDVICFTSSSTVENFMAAMGGVKLPETIAIAVIGPVTSKTAVECGLKVQIEAEEHTIQGLVDVIVASTHQENEIFGR